ncbi:MAG TPA: hypothetical protein DD417_09525 [Elusimicrobia bacterium]|nr:hypothetical protein [Elusimicrobiota bacterium]
MKTPTSTHCKTCLARNTGSFAKISPQGWTEFQRFCSSNTYAKGNIIFYANNQPLGLFFLCSGKVKVVKSAFGVRAHIPRVIKAPDLLGDRAFISGELYSGTGVAMEPSHICFLDAAHMNRIFAKEPAFWQFMARRFADELGAAEDRMVDLALKTIRERLAKYLLALSGPDEDGRGVRVELEESRQETAEILGTTTEAICRTLAEFRSRRWISIKGPFVLIQDPERLRQLAGLPAASL